jgi:hypothetical protein
VKPFFQFSTEAGGFTSDWKEVSSAAHPGNPPEKTVALGTGGNGGILMVDFKAATPKDVEWKVFF